MTTKLIHEIYLKVGTQVYQGVVTDVNVPGIDPTVWEGSTDTNIVADVPTGQRKINIVGRQDWEDANSLCEFVLTNEGEAAEIIFSHRPGGTVYFKVNAVIGSFTAGGPLNQFGNVTGAWPCTKPVIVAAPA